MILYLPWGHEQSYDVRSQSPDPLASCPSDPNMKNKSYSFSDNRCEHFLSKTSMSVSHSCSWQRRGIYFWRSGVFADILILVYCDFPASNDRTRVWPCHVANLAQSGTVASCNLPTAHLLVSVLAGHCMRDVQWLNLCSELTWVQFNTIIISSVK